MIKEFKDNVELYGSVVKDAEVKTIGKLTIAQTSVAIDEKVYENISSKFDRLKMVQNLRKGDNVKVIGMRRHRTYTNKEGDTKAATEIDVQWLEVWTVQYLPMPEPKEHYKQSSLAEMGDAKETDEEMPF